MEKGQIDYVKPGPNKERLIPESSVFALEVRLAETANPAPDAHAEDASTQLNGNTGRLVGSATNNLNNPEALLKERGLDPLEWEITHMKVNEWDSPTGEALKQLTVNVRRLSTAVHESLVVIDDYVAPPKSKPVNKESKLIVFVGDQQAPHHDVDLHRVFCDFLTENEPDEGVLMGDTLDFPDVSRHAGNPEWDANVQECVNAGYLILRDYVQSSEQTEWTKLMGNHDERIRNKLLALIPNLHGLRRADEPGKDSEAPVWCVSSLLRLKELGIAFLAPNGGYNHAQVKVSDKLAARHGWVARKGSGASALSTLDHLGYSIVVGHTHRQSLVHQTKHDIDGTTQTLAAAETGCMCNIVDGLGYTVAPDWQNGFATAQVWEDGTFKLDLATFVNGVLYWRDQRYE